MIKSSKYSGIKKEPRKDFFFFIQIKFHLILIGQKLAEKDGQS